MQLQDPNWVEDQRRELLRAEQATKQAALESGAFVGVVARLSRATGLAVVDCLEYAQQHGGDASIAGNLLQPDLQVGDSIVFRVGQSAKGPAAVFAKRLAELSQHRQRIMEAEAPPAAPDAPSTGQEFLGFITSFQPERGFGFISCAETRQSYGSDVYIHRDQFTDVTVGDAVHFLVALNPKGVPAARSVRKAVAAAAEAKPAETKPAEAKPQKERSCSRSMSRSMSISDRGGKRVSRSPPKRTRARSDSRRRQRDSRSRSAKGHRRSRRSP